MELSLAILGLTRLLLTIILAPEAALPLLKSLRQPASLN
tara:strand:+ start:122 stop:238 length:117 start_codon:yes stop_codon:yes gene_type:complete